MQISGDDVTIAVFICFGVIIGLLVVIFHHVRKPVIIRIYESDGSTVKRVFLAPRY